jgi:hypothetical protein
MHEKVLDTVDRILKIMESNWDTKSLAELSENEILALFFLHHRVDEFSKMQAEKPDMFDQLGITEKEVMIFNNYVEWLNIITGVKL